jgi:diketogulonate reductase-like aldo/keto reductase
MRYETIHNIKIPKVGFGTWTIGGHHTADPASDERSLFALHSALKIGYTHFDTAEMYAAGHAEELLARAIRQQGIARESLFITSKVSPQHLNYENVLLSCENSLRRLDMDYLDLYLIHWPIVGMKLEETFRGLNKLVQMVRCGIWE